MRNRLHEQQSIGPPPYYSADSPQTRMNPSQKAAMRKCFAQRNKSRTRPKLPTSSRQRLMTRTGGARDQTRSDDSELLPSVASVAITARPRTKPIASSCVAQ
jgi:hypothetical protein